MVKGALLFSVDDSVDADLILRLRNKMEGASNLEVFDLSDVSHEHEELSSYTEKFKQMIKTRINRVFLINSPKLRNLVESNNFNVDNTNLSTDQRAQEIIREMIARERVKSENESKLVLLSLSEKEEVPHSLQQIKHVCVIDGNGRIDSKIIDGVVIGLCQMEIPRASSEKKSSEKKDSGCIVA